MNKKTVRNVANCRCGGVVVIRTNNPFEVPELLIKRGWRIIDESQSSYDIKSNWRCPMCAAAYEEIINMKDIAFCDLVGLKGVRKRKIDGYLIKEAKTDYIKKILEKGGACVAAGDNGSFNVWKTDAGIIRGEAMRHCVTIESKRFSTYEEASEWVEIWLDNIQ